MQKSHRSKPSQKSNFHFWKRDKKPDKTAKGLSQLRSGLINPFHGKKRKPEKRPKKRRVLDDLNKENIGQMAASRSQKSLFAGA